MLKVIGAGFGRTGTYSLKVALEQLGFGEMLFALMRRFAPCSLSDKEQAIAAFERHNREVRERVSEERLLVMDVREGWAPLCCFLDVPVPDGPFPHLNDRQEFQNRDLSAGGVPPQ
jgi:hypothetical protein